MMLSGLKLPWLHLNYASPCEMHVQEFLLIKGCVLRISNGIMIHLNLEMQKSYLNFPHIGVLENTLIFIFPYANQDICLG